jgi:hypothetical protein
MPTDHDVDDGKEQADARLNEFDREEWRDIARIFRPDWTEEDFDDAWKEFIEMKRRKSLQ